MEKEEIKKEKQEKKKSKKGLIVVIIIFIILVLIIAFLLFQLLKPKTIKFDLGNGQTEEIVIKDGEKITFPDPPVKEGYDFSGWANKKGEFVLETSDIDEKDVYTPIYIDKNKKIYILTFMSDGVVIGTFKLEEGKTLIEPIRPTKEGYVFMGWLNEDGNLINYENSITRDRTFTAYWISEKSDYIEVSFDTDGGNEIESIKVEKGRTLVLPVNPTKTGYAFGGWFDENGNSVTNQTIASRDFKLKATWKDPYTCPENCTPVGDGSTCTRVDYRDKDTYTVCPSGYSNVNGHCVDSANSFSAYTTDGACPAGYYQYDEIYGLGADIKCAKEVSREVRTSCPDGYTDNGTNCQKDETINCTAN